MGFLLVLLNASVHIEPLHQLLGVEARKIAATLSVDQSLALMPGLLFTCYIVVAEGWMWSMRMRTRRALLIIDDIRKNYQISLAKAKRSRVESKESIKQPHGLTAP